MKIEIIEIVLLDIGLITQVVFFLFIISRLVFLFSKIQFNSPYRNCEMTKVA